MISSENRQMAIKLVDEAMEAGAPEGLPIMGIHAPCDVGKTSSVSRRGSAGGSTTLPANSEAEREQIIKTCNLPELEFRVSEEKNH